MHTVTPGQETGLGGERAGASPEPRPESLATQGGGSAGPGWARSIAPGLRRPQVRPLVRPPGGLGSGPRLPCLLQMPEQLLKLPFPGGGGSPPTRPAQRLSCPHKGGPTRPAPQFPLNFPSFRKEKLPGRRLREPSCVGATEGTRPFPPERQGRPGPTVKSGGEPPSAPRRARLGGGGGHSPDFRTCGGIVLAMRVHRTMCSGHRPRSSPRPMAAPAARHRPEPRLRLRAAPSRDPAPAGRADARARCGAARQPGGGPGGRRRAGRPPAAEGSCAGGRLLPPASARAGESSGGARE